MNLQILLDSKGNNSGVYITPEQWLLIKQQYPDIEEISNELPDWQKEILTNRLQIMKESPESIKPIQGLLDILRKKA